MTLLFLKKKKQKDFYPDFSERQCRRHCPTGKSFLVLFFKKEQASSSFLAPITLKNSGFL